MFKHRRLCNLLLIGLLLITVIACDISFDGNDEKSSQEDIEIQLTVASLQRTQTAAAAPPENSQKQPEDTQPDQDSDADDSSDDDSGDDSDGSACNSSKFVSETIADGTVYPAGAAFTKTWTLRNAGDCDWTTDYKFVFEGGDQMGGDSTVNVPSVVKPGETITFSVDLKAPATSGDYTGVWRLKAADGEKLGKYWVKITVGSGGTAPADEEESPSTPFAVTSVTYPHIDDILCICPTTLGVAANVTVNKAGTVTYRWDDNKGGTSTSSVVFDAAGTKTVHHSIPIPGGGDGTYSASLYIDVPNHQFFGSISVDVDCS